MNPSSNYNAANHDFTIRYALQNRNTKNMNSDENNTNININSWSASDLMANSANHRMKHLWNIATSTASTTARNFNINNCTNISIDTENDCLENKRHQQKHYSEKEAENIVREFALRFPHFTHQLKEQFPKEWLEIKSAVPIQQSTVNANKLFQFYQLQRSEKERLMQEIFEYENK